jgi:hypothetical protein
MRVRILTLPPFWRSFPEKITDVRIRAAAQDEAEDIAPPSVAESSEGDILPGDDIEF